MITNHTISDMQERIPVSIPRVHSETDLSNLSRRRRYLNGQTKSRSHRSQSCASVGISEDRMSENSQVLYMAPNKESRRRKRSPLVSTDNISVAIINEMVDKKEEINNAAEELAWNVIDQEISMWIYVCETGRPYCWSTESRYNRSKKLQPKLPTQPGTRVWARGMKDYHSTTCDIRRQTVSESNLIKESHNVDTLAQMIALQLLGSCFTIPPDNLTDDHTNCTSYEMADPRMISSLRLHTHFRYSPCFGHEPRSSSPVQLWPGIYDGPLAPPEENINLKDSNLYTNEPEYGCGSGRRTLNNSETSTSGYSVQSADGNMSRRNTLDTDPYAITKAWHRRNSLREAVSRSLTLPHLPNDGKIFRMQSRSKKRKQKTTTPDGYLTPPSTCSRELFKSRSKAISSRLQPVLRSEPHPVFVQPVKELVVKPWRNFRRKFRSSVRSSQYHESSEDLMPDAGQSGNNSPIIGEGRLRRIRAQERGDIYSSGDSVGQNNTPEGGSCSEDSPCHNTPATALSQQSSWLSSGNASPRLDLPDPIASRAAEALLASNYMAIPKMNTRGTVSSPLQPPPTPTTISLRTTPGTPGSTMSTLGDLPIFSSSTVSCNSSSNLTEFQLKTMQTASEFPSSSMRIPNSRRRKSCLSEVFMPEEFRNPDGDQQINERSVYSTSTPGNPQVTPLGSTYPSNDHCPNHCLSPVAPIRAVDAVALIAPSLAAPESTRLQRMSSSGTQIFAPDPNESEIDGLPVGLGKEIWSGPGRDREPSFL